MAEGKCKGKGKCKNCDCEPNRVEDFNIAGGKMDLARNNVTALFPIVINFQDLDKEVCESAKEALLENINYLKGIGDL